MYYLYMEPNGCTVQVKTQPQRGLILLKKSPVEISEKERLAYEKKYNGEKHYVKGNSGLV